MSGGKGTSSTPVTQTATNPLAKYVTGAAEYLTPYAQDPNRPYTAPPNPLQAQGYSGISNTANNIEGWPQAKAYDAYGNLITGGGTSPAYGGYGDLAAGTAGPQHNADIWGNQAATGNIPNAFNMANYANQATAGNVGQDQLAAVAQGKYLDPASNPYLRQMADASLRQASDSYQMSTAPTTDARFSGGGRYGSGANDAAVRANQDTFLRGQGDITNNFYGQQYRFERGQQDTDAVAYDQARRAGLGLGITGLQAAGNLTDQGLRTALSAADLTQRGQMAGLAGLDTGFGRGLTAEQNALQNFPQFIQSLFAPDKARVEAGTGLRDLDTSVNREPYDRVNAYLKSISGAGANAAGSSSTTPYFTNDIASAISGLSGAATLGKQLGIGDLIKGGSSLAIPGLSSAEAAGVGALFPGATQTAAGLAGYAALPEIASSAAAFAPAASSAGKGASSFLPAFLIP